MERLVKTVAGAGGQNASAAVPDAAPGCRANLPLMDAPELRPEPE